MLLLQFALFGTSFSKVLGSLLVILLSLCGLLVRGLEVVQFALINSVLP